MYSHRTRRVRLIRWLGFDANPLRRTCDRVEAWLVLGVIVAFLPLAVLATSFAGRLVHDAGVREQQAAHARQVPAVLLAGSQVTHPALGVPGWLWVPARWTVGHATHTGNVKVAYGTPKGSTVRIWVGDHGRLVSPPPTSAQLANRGLAAMVAVPLVLAEFLALALCLLHWLLNRRRFAAWDAEWWSIDPLRARRPE